MSKLCLGCMKEIPDAAQFCTFCGYKVGTPPEESYHLMPGTILKDRYIVGKVLGFGSFGITYIGYDVRLNRTVAIKEYLPGEFSTRSLQDTTVNVYTGESEEQFSSGLAKFTEEAERLGQLRGEAGIVHIYDDFEENGTAYIIMEYLTGESLKDKIEREGRIPENEAFRILGEMLNGLIKAHSYGILHRDIAPDNVYITEDGSVKLIDFGAARFATTRKSRSLTVQIKSGYTPVEQYQSHGNQGPWTDVYAAAATCYKMLTGETPQDSMERKVNDRLIPPSEKGVRIQKSLENALMNALNVEAGERTQTAEDFLSEILADEVKRIEVKKVSEDTGGIPIGAKLGMLFGGGLVVIFIVLLLTGVISFSSARSGTSSIPEGQFRVPNLISRTLDEAEKEAKDNSFELEVSGKDYSDEVPKNRILTQSLQGGSLAEKGTVMEVTLSAGIEQTYVPDVIGLSLEEATSMLLKLGLVWETEKTASNIAPACVVSQNIEQGTAVDSGTTVLLTISEGSDGVSESAADEDLVGKTWSQALKQAEKGGYYIKRSESVYSDTAEKDRIIGQTQEKTSSGYPVAVLVVSNGKERVTVPDVELIAAENAGNLLKEAGLTYNVVEKVSDSVPEGNVVSQSIPANTKVEKGTQIEIVVSVGAEEKQEEETESQQTEQVQEKPRTQAQPKTQPQTEAQTQPPAETDNSSDSLFDMIDF